jgi:hypothetical protein
MRRADCLRVEKEAGDAGQDGGEQEERGQAAVGFSVRDHRKEDDQARQDRRNTDDDVKYGERFHRHAKDHDSSRQVTAPSNPGADDGC